MSVREDHSSITYPNSDAMAWVTAHLRDLVRTWPAPAAPPIDVQAPAEPPEER